MVDRPSRTRNRGTLRGFCSFSLAACVGVVAVVTACDESFEPIAPSAFAFSVFGYLDASADTQWIRVMPIRPLRVTSPDPLGARVTLEHLESGRIIDLRDSVFRFSSFSEGLGAEDAYVHNYWTPEAIEPGATYRFSVRRDGTDPAEAVVEVPRDYEVQAAIGRWGGTDQLRITGVKHLPFLTVSTYYYDDCGSDVRRIQDGGRSAEDETYAIAVTKQDIPSRYGCGVPVPEKREIWIAGSETPWPAGGYAPGALGESGSTSNVTDGVGFLGGVLTKVIPYEDCEFRSDGAPVPPYCLLRYGPETATVTGTVREPLCVGPLDSVTVRLSELGRDPARIRTVLTTRAGGFLIGALEPGIPHALWVRAPQVPIDSVFDTRAWRYVYTEWTDVHTLHTDTLTLMPGQRLEYAIQLARLFPCGAGTLLGTVTETRCGDGPIDSATLELTELNVTPPDNPRTHIGRTNGNGEFLITGLRPQFIHFLRVRGPDTVVDSVYNPETGRWDPVLENIYSERIDYLRFLRDQVVKYDVRLGRLTSCSEPPPGAP